MRTCHIGGTDNGAKVVGILNAVQKDEERIFSLLFCLGKEVFHLRIGISRNFRDHALVPACLRHLVQALAIHILDRRAALGRFLAHRLHGTFFAAVQHI